MTEKFKLIDLDFWKNPSIWKTGKGYIPTKIVGELVVLADAFVFSMAFLMNRIQRVSTTEETLYLLPYMFPATVALFGAMSKVDEAVKMRSFSKWVIDTGGINKMMLRNASNLLSNSDAELAEYEEYRDEKGLEQIRVQRESMEMNLGSFANAIVKREKLKV